MSRKVTRLRFLAGSLGGVRAASAAHSFPTVLVLLNHTQPIQYQNPSALLCSRLMMVLKRLLQGTPAHCKLLQGGRFVHQCVGPWGQSPTEKVTAFHNISTSLVLQVVCVLYKEIFPIPVVPEIPQLMLPGSASGSVCVSASRHSSTYGPHRWSPQLETVGDSSWHQPLSSGAEDNIMIIGSRLPRKMNLWWPQVIVLEQLQLLGGWAIGTTIPDVVKQKHFWNGAPNHKQYNWWFSIHGGTPNSSSRHGLPWLSKT